MNQETLNILHLKFTGNSQLDKVCEERYNLLMQELSKAGVGNYALWNGFYEKGNTKKAIHLGHRQIVQFAKDNHYEYCLIAEDDIVFTHPDSYRYFLQQVPSEYDLFMGLVYSGEIKDNKVMNGFSGGLSLYRINRCFFEEFLSMPVDTHIDRQLGLTCYKNRYYVTPKYCVEQRGLYSFQLRKPMNYKPYLDGQLKYEGD